MYILSGTNDERTKLLVYVIPDSDEEIDEFQNDDIDLEVTLSIRGNAVKQEKLPRDIAEIKSAFSNRPRYSSAHYLGHTVFDISGVSAGEYDVTLQAEWLDREKNSTREVRLVKIYI